jgi:hypothetical protein
VEADEGLTRVSSDKKSVVECLPKKCEALISSPSAAKKKRRRRRRRRRNSLILNVLDSRVNGLVRGFRMTLGGAAAVYLD